MAVASQEAYLMEIYIEKPELISGFVELLNSAGEISKWSGQGNMEFILKAIEDISLGIPKNLIKPITFQFFEFLDGRAMEINDYSKIPTPLKKLAKANP